MDRDDFEYERSFVKFLNVITIAVALMALIVSIVSR